MAVASANKYRSSRFSKFNDKDAEYWPIIWSDNTTVTGIPSSLEGVENGNLVWTDRSQLLLCSKALIHPWELSNYPKSPEEYIFASDYMAHPWALGALELMIRYAAVDGVFMRLNNAYRTYAQQKSSFEGRYATTRPSLKYWNRKATRTSCLQKK